jgi:hypothetical protein
MHVASQCHAQKTENPYYPLRFVVSPLSSAAWTGFLAIRTSIEDRNYSDVVSGKDALPL